MRIVGLLSAALLSGACASGGEVPAPRTYDLGIAAPATRLPAVRIAPVRGIPPFDGVEMHYRLAWRNAAELASFSHSRWAAPPAELLRRHLLRAGVDGNARCILEMELAEFSQVFSAPAESAARVELHAVLSGPKGRIGGRGWSLSEAGAGADAAGGVGALARAAERVTGELAAWIAAQPDCR